MLVFTGRIDTDLEKLTEKAGTVLVVGIMTVIGGEKIGMKIEGTGEGEILGKGGAVLTGNKANMVNNNNFIMTC